MKHISALLVASAISGLGASAAMAGPDFTAAIGAGPQTIDFASVSGDGYGVYGLLSGANNFTPVLGAQGDLLVRYSHFESDGAEADIASLDAVLHAFYRDSERFLVGGFAQFGHDTLKNSFYEAGSNRYYVGAEGQAFLDQFTAYGQVGWQKTAPDDNDVYLEGWFITGELRYFVTPDLKVEVHAGHKETTVNVPEAPELRTLNFGLGAEYRLPDLPFSVFGKYDYSTTSIADWYSVDSHRVLVGLKFNLGDDSLQQRDRNGASLKPVDFGSNYEVGGIEID